MAVAVASPASAKQESASLEPLALTFKALSDPTRLKILRHLVTQEAGCCAPGETVCACDLEVVTGLSQPTVSHHMKCLISVNLVTGEKQGKWMYYRIDLRGFKRVQDALPLLGSQ